MDLITGLAGNPQEVQKQLENRRSNLYAKLCEKSLVLPLKAEFTASLDTVLLFSEFIASTITRSLKF